MPNQQEVAISKHIVKRLGERGVEETMASLFPVDCQTCNRPLTGTTVALVVTDMMIFARAALHHRRCHKSEWNDSGMVPSAGGATLSHRMRTPMLPWTNASTGEVVMQPMYLLNPGLEAVFLERDDDEQWHVKLPNQFTAAGLVHDARQISERPVEEATAGSPTTAWRSRWRTCPRRPMCAPPTRRTANRSGPVGASCSSSPTP